VRLPEVPATYSPQVEKERNRTLEIAAKQYVRTDGDAQFGVTPQIKSGAYTAAARDYILADTSGGAFTITLPEPNDGDYVIVADDGGNWATNNLTVARAGNTIEGAATDLVCDLDCLEVTLIYNGTTWRVYV